jgi:HEAT repeat protein
VVTPSAAAAPPPSPSPSPSPSKAAAKHADEVDLVIRAGGKRRLAYAVSVAVVIGGVGLVGWELFGRGEAAAKVGVTGARAVGDATPGAVAAAPTAGAPAAPATDGSPQALYRAALAELGRLLDSPSPRIRRLAAQALARTGDAKALGVLAELLESEPSTLSRIQIAYALARAGAPAGRAHLVSGLNHTRRDVRMDAARALVELGDDAGKNALYAMLTVESHRIGAAGLLARLGDERGKKLLKDELEGKSSTEVKMRAAVELGRAGDASVTKTLEGILADRRYNVGAADALAALGDAGAVPALERQLELSSLRVSAARWLRKLGKAVPLAPLGGVLSRGDEPDRASAAEAILVLAGPAALAERE